MSVKVIAFDLNGTVLDLSGRPDGEIASYGQHLRTCTPPRPWQPWSYPVAWETLPAHLDAAEGIKRLRAADFICVTLSNNPMPLQVAQSKHNNIEWDGIVPLEAFRTFKTDPAAYLSVCQLWRVRPCDVMMVTANKTFGDLEAAAALGMQPQLIRHEDARVATIIDLAEVLS